MPTTRFEPGAGAFGPPEGQRPASAIGRLRERFDTWRLSKIASEDFQRWAARFPLTRGFARRDAARVYDLVSGFVYSQVLLALVELEVFRHLRDGPQRADTLALTCGVSAERMRALCQAAASVGLLARGATDTYRLGRLGAAVLGVPGLEDMIRHHKVFYRDLADPVGLLRGETDPELSRFWSYVRGGEGVDAETARTYSALMESSQHLVAEETLDAVDFGRFRNLADIGGGTGMFLEHVAARHSGLGLSLFDLPGVVATAERRLGEAGLAGRIRLCAGNFRTGTLPGGCDAMSLIRVLYDHDDPTVAALLAQIHTALPPGGQIVISEPMSGGDRPCRAGDAYFGFYTMAMTTGRPRSAARHAELLRQAGFADPVERPTRRPFLTSVVVARKPGPA
ncbi:MAG: methyltransferase [Pseudomonadota bacterium]